MADGDQALAAEPGFHSDPPQGGGAAALAERRFTGQQITWEEALNSKENLWPEITDWKSPVTVPPVAIPGQTKFI